MRLPSFITKPLLRWAERVQASRPPDRRIGPTDAPYMERWHIYRNNKLGGLYLHVFHHDDDDRALHDHPFRSLSISIDGEMREIYAENGSDPKDTKQHSARIVRTGKVVARGGRFSHRMELLTDTATTLFFIGPHFRDWGFHCPRGWRSWRDYCDPLDPNKVGPGCD